LADIEHFGWSFRRIAQSSRKYDCVLQGHPFLWSFRTLSAFDTMQYITLLASWQSLSLSKNYPCHCTKSWISLSQSTTPHPTSFRFTSFHLRLGLFLPVIRSKLCMYSYLSCKDYRPIHPILHDPRY
jgi:hypothetical protein